MTNFPQLPIQAVIMAGGQGMRLRPLTESKPKPMLEVNGKPILEYLIDRLIRCGVRDIVISLNYLGEQIETYFGDGSSKGARITYVWENQPMGTFGSLSLIEQFAHESLLVMNSDLLTDLDFAAFFQYYQAANADFMVSLLPYKHRVPYGVFELDSNNLVKGVVEKPEYTWYTNGGIYLVERRHIALMPKGKRFDATDFINLAIEKQLHTASYPLECYWRDIGKMEDYAAAQEDVRGLDI